MRYMEPVETRKSVSQLRRGTVEYCVLALLRGGARYGFELVRELSDVDGLVTSEGTIYPLLTGREALDDFAKEWARFRDSVDAILNKEEG